MPELQSRSDSGQAPEVEQPVGGSQFMSMVLNTHSVNFLSLVEAL